MQLLVDPAIDTHRANLLGLAGTRSEREPIQDLLHLFVRQQLTRLR
jgi:hypothetical protein